jgi:hypothetical protein
MTRVALDVITQVGQPEAKPVAPTPGPVGHATRNASRDPAVKITGGPVPAHEAWSGPERLVRAAGLPQSVRAGR